MTAREIIDALKEMTPAECLEFAAVAERAAAFARRKAAPPIMTFPPAATGPKPKSED